MCIEIVEIWLGVVDGQILSIFDSIICPQLSIDFHQSWYVHWYCGDLLWGQSSCSEETLDPWLSKEHTMKTQIRCADAQADLSLHYVHMFRGSLFFVAAHILCKITCAPCKDSGQPVHLPVH